MPSLAFHRTVAALLLLASVASAQQKPYDVFPAAEPPYYRVRYEASTKEGELPYAVNYTLWIPKDVKTLSGVVVHQHGHHDIAVLIQAGRHFWEKERIRRQEERLI